MGGDGLGGARGVEAVEVAGVGEGPVAVFGRVGGGVDLGGGKLAGWLGLLWMWVSSQGNRAVDRERL